MQSSVLLRRLTTATTATTPSPLTQSILTRTPSALSPWLNHRFPSTRNNRPSRSFHSTPIKFSSPFRLSSKTPDTNANTNDAEEYAHTHPNEESPLARYAPYKPKRQWPPDMTKLSPKHQFRLERKYRRRAALKFARPKWTKGTKLVQWGVILSTLAYAVLFMDWDKGKSPFDELREALFAGAKGAFSAPPAPESAKKSERE